MLHRTEVFENERGFSLGWKGRLVILSAALVGLGLFVYSEILSGLLNSVLHREGSSHGLFVPFISGYFLWLKREEIRNAEIEFALVPGGAIIVLSSFIFYLSHSSTEITLPAFSFVLAASGLVLALFGIRLFKEVAFPLLFLITMIPLPRATYAHIGGWMREAVTSGSVWLMQVIHHPIFREGYNIQLQNTNLFIAMGCSGIRYLLSYFVFSLAYAFLFKRASRSRVLVVLASFPMALVAGVLRLSSIYLATSYIGPFMAEHRPHVLLSWSVFGMVLVLTIAADQYVSGVWERRKAGGEVGSSQ